MFTAVLASSVAPGLTLFAPAARPASSRRHRPRASRHRHAQPLAQLDDRADDGFELHRPAGLEVLQHRRLVRAHLLRAGHPLIDRDRQLDAEPRRHRLGFHHQLAHQPRDVRMARQLLERSAGQRADRIERDVAQQLHPDLMAESRASPGSESPQRSALRQCRASARLRAPSGSPKLIRLPSM